MADYIVSIDNEEYNREANNLSLTGRVNGIQCAAVCRLSQIEAIPGSRERKVAKQHALVEAYLKRQAAPENIAGERISL